MDEGLRGSSIDDKEREVEDSEGRDGGDDEGEYLFRVFEESDDTADEGCQE